MNKKEYSNFNPIIIGLIIIGTMCLILGVLLSMQLCKKEIVKVDCYDKLGNKINGVTCDNYECIKGEYNIFDYLTLIGFGLLLLGIFLYILNVNIQSYEEGNEKR
jgi:uncharacterized membrane protein